MQNQGRGNRNNRGEKPDPLMKVEWCRVLDQPMVGDAMVVVTEPAFHIIRLRPKSSADLQMIGARIYMGIEHSLREVVQDVLGFARIRDLSNNTLKDMPIIIQKMIEDAPEVFIQQFFNRAGNLSMKMHAFELLPGIGNKKAMDMIAKRGRMGWENFAQLSEDCNIDGPELLARRFVSEINDRDLQPRLLDLLLRQDE